MRSTPADHEPHVSSGLPMHTEEILIGAPERRTIAVGRQPTQKISGHTRASLNKMPSSR